MQIQDLINHIDSSPERYKHLQIFLHREGNDCKSDCEFLMVSPTVFGKVELLDIQVEEDYIALKYLDCAMQMVGNVRINIKNELPQILFLSWSDIKKMVYSDKKSSTHSSDQLDFDF